MEPDGAEEHLFEPLAGELAARLRSVYLAALAEEGELPERDLTDWVDLRVAPDDEPGAQRLRITSSFTGGTRWLYDWRGDEEAARGFLREVARADAHDLEVDRQDAGLASWQELFR